MSFILVPQRGSDLCINGWNWRPTLLLISRAGILSDEEYERLGANGCGGRVDSKKAAQIATVIEAQLSAMKPGERMRADLSIVPTAQPTDLRSDSNELYSASYNWLRQFRDFCLSCDGFEVL